jgi:zinc transporter ZupT
MNFFGGSTFANAYFATFVISVLPNVLLFFIPQSWIENTDDRKKTFNVQHILLCFAAAGLMGDVFLHTLVHLLLPDHHSHNHAHHEESHHHEEHHDHHHEDEHHHHDNHDEHSSHHEACEADGNCGIEATAAFDIYSHIGLERETAIQIILLLGFLTFLVVEKIANRSLGHGHSYSHSHVKDIKEEQTIQNESAQQAITTTPGSQHMTRSTTKRPKSKTKSPNSPSKVTLSSTEGSRTSDTSDEKTVDGSLMSSIFGKLQGSGWLNLLADSLHNFTDGIAIGASFASGQGLQ